MGNFAQYKPKKPNHNRFLETLRHSMVAVEVAALWLRQEGYEVSSGYIMEAPRHEDWKKYSDNGDLWIKGKNDKHELRVEIKHLSVEFSSLNDWPFGKDFILCSKHSFDRSFPKPYSYLIFSNSLTHAASVIVNTKDMFVKTQHDSKYDRLQEFYYVPLSCVTFYKVPEPLIAKAKQRPSE